MGLGTGLCEYTSHIWEGGSLEVCQQLVVQTGRGNDFSLGGRLCVYRKLLNTYV